MGFLVGVRSVTGVGVAFGAIGFALSGEPLWIAAGTLAGASLEWLERFKQRIYTETACINCPDLP